MPNFNTHWLVAINSLDAAPTYIRSGYAEYRRITKEFSKKLHNELETVTSPKTYGTFVGKTFKRLCKEYEENLKGKLVHDNITCFSAYMLGACGPDFWTTTSKSNWGITPDTASIHFELGHYNRTHHQFQVAVERWKKKAGSDKKSTQSLQFKVEVSYFLGVTCHIAADTIFHQLVNAYAGTYNLLETRWGNEHGSLPKNLWNTHNKVEHFWDSYMRYRYLGDYGPLWPDKDKQDIMAPMGMPVVESLIKKVQRRESFPNKKELLKWLKNESNKLKIEKCFIFPRIACDRIGKKNAVKPFIYDIMVDKKGGAYPSAEIFDKAEDEAESYQMGDPGGGRSEYRKLAYFRSDNNGDTNFHSFNYLNYYVCPNLAHTAKYGLNIFYHFKAFEPFINAGTQVSRDFINKFQKSIEKQIVASNMDKTETDAIDVGSVGHFWSLDTGQGLIVSKVAADTGKEAITELDFVNICDFLEKAAIKYRDHTTDLKCMQKGVSFQTISYPSPPKRAFDTYTGKTFTGINDVYEESDKKKAYLDKIRLKQRVSLQCKVTVETFFKKVEETSVRKQLAETAQTKETNEIEVADQKHRLTLRLKTAIVPFRPKDRLGFYLLGDTKKGIKESVQYKVHMQKKWLKNKGTKALEVLKADTGAGDKLAAFQAHLLINFENEKNLERKIAKGQWNNVVPYGTHKDHYGRNFAICTGRQNVLTPSGSGTFSGTFNGQKHFNYFKDMSPTEQVFFSLYLLVRTEKGCFDMISKQEVTQKDLDAVKKIECIGFVKIVLFYVLDKNGVSQVEACYVDGLKVPIETKFD